MASEPNPGPQAHGSRSLQRPVSVPGNLHSMSINEVVWQSAHRDRIQPQDSVSPAADYSRIGGSFSTMQSAHAIQQKFCMDALARKAELQVDINAWEQKGKIEEEEFS